MQPICPAICADVPTARTPQGLEGVFVHQRRVQNDQRFVFTLGRACDEFTGAVFNGCHHVLRQLREAVVLMMAFDVVQSITFCVLCLLRPPSVEVISTCLTS